MRREFTRNQREQIVERAMRSKSSNFKWLESAISEARNDCLAWPFARRANGYGQIFWRGIRTTTHRVACELAHGPAPKIGMEAAHSCGNRICCNPRHLRWASAKENAADRVTHGTHFFGEKCPSSKLTSKEVRQIRALLKRGYSLSVIARNFKVSLGSIWDIKSGKTWRGQPNAS